MDVENPDTTTKMLPSSTSDAAIIVVDDESPPSVQQQQQQQPEQQQQNFGGGDKYRGGGGWGGGRGRGNRGNNSDRGGCDRGGDRTNSGRGRGGGGGGGFRRSGNNNNRQDYQRRSSNNNQFNNDENEMDGDLPGFLQPPQHNQFMDKLQEISGPTHNLPPLDDNESTAGDRKFSGKNRLYVGNLAANTTDDDINALFSQYGELAHVFMFKEKHFGFVTFDYYANAEKAKAELNGTLHKEKTIKVRFASSLSSIKVKNLTSPHVSNELLYHAFKIFGDVERAVVLVDERGKPTGEGIVDFVRKAGAQRALRKCTDDCFFLLNNLQPCIVESYEATTDTDGYPEAFMYRKSNDYSNARSTGPHFAQPDTFQERYGQRWKELYELFEQKRAALKCELEFDKDKLTAQMEYARYEHETQMMREELRVREMYRDKQKNDWQRKERMFDEFQQQNQNNNNRGGGGRGGVSGGGLVKRPLVDEDLRQQPTNVFIPPPSLVGGGGGGNVLPTSIFERPPPKKIEELVGGGDVVEPKAFINQFKKNSEPDSMMGGQQQNQPQWRNFNSGNFDFKRRRRL